MRAGVFIVGCDARQQGLLKASLDSAGVDAVFVSTGDEALRQLERDLRALVIADWALPDMPGRHFFQHIHEHYPDTVCVALGESSQLHELKPAVDARYVYRFYIKPVEEVTLEVAIEEALHYHSLLLKKDKLDAEVRSANNILSKLKEQFAGSVQPAPEDKLVASHYDALTSLPNRLLLMDRLRQAVNHARRQKQKLAVLSIDIDRFTRVNQSMGTEQGNQLLGEVAERLMVCIRDADTVAREGNDEFALVVTGLDNEERAAQIARRVKGKLQKPFIIDGQEHFLTCSIGICLYPNDGDEPEVLLQAANTAMNHAKKEGGNRYYYYESEMNARVARAVGLESGLRRALEREEFVMFYQPQVDLKTGHVIGAEALLRWIRPDIGMVSPGEFIPVLEDTGLIEPVGEWIIQHVAQQRQEWLESGLPPVRMSVNLSARQFQDDSLVKRIRAMMLIAGGLDAARGMELEITESLLMRDVGKTIGMLGDLADMGFKLAIDDFGTGYASLSYLTRFPIHTLKIDLSFVQRIDASPRDAAIVDAIIAMGRSLDLKLVAEGVENQQQLDYLCGRRCDEMQGFFFCKPLPAVEFEQLLRDGKRLLLPA
jgi:diguanylate cyclase (GGDEF)-like protein